MEQHAATVGVLIAAIAVGVIAHAVVQQDASLLGLSRLELFLLTAGITAVAKRRSLA